MNKKSKLRQTKIRGNSKGQMHNKKGTGWIGREFGTTQERTNETEEK